MNNIMQQDVAENRIVNSRYQLGQCVFANHSGSLYLAADNQQAHADSHVLIHIFPKRSIGYEELSELFSLLQQRDQRSNIDGWGLLTVLDCGWLGMSAYFVLTVPDKRSASQLKPLPQEPTDQRYQQAVAISGDLLRQGAISKGLTPQSFIVESDALYLLPTALLEQFQQQQREAELLTSQRAGYSGRSVRWLSLLGWGAVTSVLAGGGGYAYYLSQQQEEIIGSTVLPVATSNNAQQVHIQNKRIMEADAMQEQQSTTLSPNIEPMVVRPVVPETAQPIVRHSEPVTPEPVSVKPAPVPSLAAELDAQEVLPVTTIMPAAIKIAQTAKEAAAKEAAAKEAAAKEAAAKEAAAKEAAAKEAAAKEAAAKEAAAKEAAAKEAAAKEAAAKEAAAKEAMTDVEKKRTELGLADGSEAKEDSNSIDAKQDAKTPPINKKGEPTSGGFTKKELVQKAYQAIDKDKLSEAAGKGAVYYIRLLKRLDRTDPQINRLARNVVSAYHVKTRRAIQRKHKLSAQRLLWVAGRIIKEFNLAQMNKAHAVLQRRIENEFLK